MVSMRQRTPPMPPLARRTVTLSKPALTRPMWFEIVRVEAKARSGQRGKNSIRKASLLRVHRAMLRSSSAVQPRR